MVRLQTLDLRIGVRVPASQPNKMRRWHVFLLTMRISLRALAFVMLACCGLWAQSAGPVAQVAAQQPAPPSSKPETEATPQTQPAPAPGDLNQPGNADIFQKAPPGVEEALRARLDLFYQCQVDATFRKGEQYVAEDSKDRYYNGRHQKYFGYEIVKIKFADDFSSRPGNRVS